MGRAKTEQRKPLRWLMFALLIFPALYVANQVITVFTPSYTYETAVLATMSDSITVDGLVLFDEFVITDSDTAEHGFLVDDGERVSAGTAVAEIYTKPEQSGVRTRLRVVSAQIDLLQKSQNITASNVDTLISQRNTAMYDLLDGLDQRQLVNIQGTKDQYLTSQNKLQITTGEALNFNERIHELEDEREALVARLGTPKQIYAPVGGYFTSVQNASFLTVGKEECLAFSPAELAEYLEKDQTYVPEQAVGKVVSSYQWYFQASCTLEQAERFTGVKTVSIRFPGRAEDELPATVVKVVVDQDAGVATVTLKCEYIGPEILHLGQETAEIIFKSYTGIRISTSAIRMVKENVQITQTNENGEEIVLNSEQFVPGVYVKHGNVAKFRRIETMYEGNGYVLISTSGKVGTSNEVRMYDEVIVEGTDLYDGKLLNG